MKKVLVLFILLSFNANAKTPNLIGKYGDWSAFYHNDGSKKTCFMSSHPVLDEGKYTSRGDIYATISSFPQENIFNVFSIKSGYEYKYGSSISIKIGSTTIDKTFTDKDNAWAINSSVDKKIIKAMRSGQRMIVDGITNKDIHTKDTYSLSGFNEAYKAINATCK